MSRLDYFAEACHLVRVAAADPVDTDGFLEDMQEMDERDHVSDEPEPDDRDVDEARDEEFSTWSDG
jgi:hypothetical protein